MSDWWRINWKSVLAGIAALILCSCLALLWGGCASTTIETPIGSYTSTRDSMLDELYIEITKAPDGTETTVVQVNGAIGLASPVIDAQTEMFRAIVEAAFAAGLKAAPGG